MLLLATPLLAANWQVDPETLHHTQAAVLNQQRQIILHAEQQYDPIARPMQHLTLDAEDFVLSQILACTVLTLSRHWSVHTSTLQANGHAANTN